MNRYMQKSNDCCHVSCVSGVSGVSGVESSCVLLCAQLQIRSREYVFVLFGAN